MELGKGVTLHSLLGRRSRQGESGPAGSFHLGASEKKLKKYREKFAGFK